MTLQLRENEENFYFIFISVAGPQLVYTTAASIVILSCP
jgi:hypothetical protein